MDPIKMPCLEGVILLTELENGFRFIIACVDLFLTVFREEIFALVCVCVVFVGVLERLGWPRPRRLLGSVFSGLFGLAAIRNWIVPYVLAAIPLTTSGFALLTNSLVASVGYDSREPIFATRITRPERLDAALRNLGRTDRVVDVRGTGTTVFYFEGARIRLPFGVRCNRRTFLGVYSKWQRLPSDRRRMLSAGIFDCGDIDYVCSLYQIAWEPWMLESCLYEGSDLQLFLRLLVVPALIVVSWLLIPLQAFYEEVLKEHELVPGAFAAFEFLTRNDPAIPSLPAFFVHFIPQYFGCGFFSRWALHSAWNLFVSALRGRSIFWHLPQTEFRFPVLPASIFARQPYYSLKTLEDPVVIAGFLADVGVVVSNVVEGCYKTALAAAVSLLSKTSVREVETVASSICDELIGGVEDGDVVALGFKDDHPGPSVRDILTSIFPRDVKYSPQAIALTSILSHVIASEIGGDRSEILRCVYHEFKKKDRISTTLELVESVRIILRSITAYFDGQTSSFFERGATQDYADLVRLADGLGPGRTSEVHEWIIRYSEFCSARDEFFRRKNLPQELSRDVLRLSDMVTSAGKTMISQLMLELAQRAESGEISPDLRASQAFLLSVPVELRDASYARSFSSFATSALRREVFNDSCVPSFPVFLIGDPNTGKTTMTSLISQEISRILSQESVERGAKQFTVGLNDNGWEGFPLAGVTSVVYNDVPSDLSPHACGLTMRSISCEWRSLVDTEPVKPYFAFEAKESTAGKGCVVVGDVMVVTSNAYAFKFDQDVGNLERRLRRGVIADVRYFFRGAYVPSEEAAQWPIDVRMARRKFIIKEPICKGKIVNLSQDAHLVLSPDEFLAYVLAKFREHRIEALRERDLAIRGDACDKCGKSMTLHGRISPSDRSKYEYVDCEGEVISVIPLGFEEIRASLETYKLWWLAGMVVVYNFAWVCLTLICFAIVSAICFFALMTSYRDELDRLGELYSCLRLAYVNRNFAILRAFIADAVRVRYVSSARTRWLRVASVLLAALGVSALAYRLQRKEKRKDTVPLMMVPDNFSTPLDFAYVNTDRKQLLRNEGPRIWDNVPRDHSYTLANAGTRKLSVEALREKVRKSTFLVQIAAVAPDGSVRAANGYAVSLNVNSLLLLRHYFLLPSLGEYRKDRVFTLSAKFAGEELRVIKEIVDPFSAGVEGSEVIVLHVNSPLPCPIAAYLPKDPLAAGFLGSGTLVNSGETFAACFNAGYSKYASSSPGVLDSSVAVYEAAIPADRGDCGSLVCVALSDEVAVVAGMLSAGVFIGGVCAQAHFVPLCQSFFGVEAKPLAMPEIVSHLNVADISTNSVSLNGMFPQIAYVGTYDVKKNQDMRSAFRETPCKGAFESGNDFWVSGTEFMKPPKATYGIVDGKKIGPIHHHLVNSLEPRRTAQSLINSEGVKEVVSRIESLPAVDLGPISFYEAVRGSNDIGLSGFDASKATGPTVQCLLGVKERERLFTETRDGFTPEFEKLLARRLFEIFDEDAIHPCVVAGADKDELRPREKIEAFKIRWFFSADVSDQLIEKVLFFPLARWCSLNFDVFRWVGNLNAVSPAWEGLYRKLLEVGSNGVAGDFKSYGASKTHELAVVVSRVVESILGRFRGYNDAQRGAVLRIVRYSVYQCVLSRGDVLMKVRGDCDGKWITLWINSLTNLVLWAWAYRECVPEGSYYEDTRGAFQGDDNIHSIKDEALPRFNGLALGPLFREVGYVYTSVDKKEVSVPFEPVSSLTFLKRDFFEHPELGVVGRLEKDSIIKSLLFYRRGSVPKEEVMRQCMRAAQMESVLYGRALFAELQSKLVRVTSESKMCPPAILDYDSELERYRSFSAFGLS